MEIIAYKYFSVQLGGAESKNMISCLKLNFFAWVQHRVWTACEWWWESRWDFVLWSTFCSCILLL